MSSLRRPTYVEDDHVLVDVGAEAEPLQAQPPLPLAWRHAGQLPDVVLAGTVGRVDLEDCDRSGEEVGELPMPSNEGSEESFESWRGPDRDAWTHALRRRPRGAAFLPLFPPRISRRRSRAARCLPARNSARLFRMWAPTFGSRSSR